jgi:hypothetical protein
MMIGTSQNVANSKKQLKNTRFVGTTNCDSTSKDQIDGDFSDYAVISKAEIPEMKLLKMEYVHKAVKPSCPPPAPPKPKCKCTTTTTTSGVIESPKISPPPPPPLKSALKVTISEPLEKNSAKYLIYKQKNHSIFGSAAVKGNNGDIQSTKLQYISGKMDSNQTQNLHQTENSSSSSSSLPKVKETNNKKRYLIFDSKKNSNKFDSIQFYFDNKSYEKYVDNKLYGKIGGGRSATPELRDISNDDLKCFENSRSWEYRDHSKTESKLKLFDNSWKLKTATTKSDGGNSSSGASSCDSEISLKRRNCRLRPQHKFTISKSIDDLSSSSKASHDVSRINQLFANATPQQLASKAKFGDLKCKPNVTNNNNSKLTRKNLSKYHRSTTELNLKTVAQSQSSSSCGFKNCKFSHCPVSNSVASAPNNNNNNSNNVNEKRKKFDENFIKKFEDMQKNLRNNEYSNHNNKSMISVNGKSNIIVNDAKNIQDFFIADGKKQNNHQNKTTIKINESCFVVNNNSSNEERNNRNVIELNNSPWGDKNIKVKNNLLAKVDNKIVDAHNKIRNEENSVKIYVSASPTPSTTLSISSSSSDSDKDYGYFDTSSQGRSSSPEFAEMFKKFKQLCKEKSMGCDGTMFWNNSYFDEEESEIKSSKKILDPPTKVITTTTTTTGALYACTKCHTTTEDLMSNYICICRNKVILYYLNRKNLESSYFAFVAVDEKVSNCVKFHSTSSDLESEEKYQKTFPHNHTIVL